jgi:hypothetical protein
MLLRLEQLTGSLICWSSRDSVEAAPTLCAKVENALNLCRNPYLLKYSNRSTLGNTGGVLARGVARRLVLLSRFNFWVACRYASLGCPVFASAADAIRHFHFYTAEDDQKVLCLPRSLFAARMSRKFADSGVILIGAFLPSRSLHAWVIEDGIQPDPTDRQWTNFKPVAALF